jgi:hypothetical protein
VPPAFFTPLHLYLYLEVTSNRLAGKYYSLKKIRTKIGASQKQYWVIILHLLTIFIDYITNNTQRVNHFAKGGFILGFNKFKKKYFLMVSSAFLLLTFCFPLPTVSGGGGPDITVSLGMKLGFDMLKLGFGVFDRFQLADRSKSNPFNRPFNPDLLPLLNDTENAPSKSTLGVTAREAAVDNSKPYFFEGKPRARAAGAGSPGSPSFSGSIIPPPKEMRHTIPVIIPLTQRAFGTTIVPHAQRALGTIDKFSASDFVTIKGVAVPARPDAFLVPHSTPYQPQQFVKNSYAKFSGTVGTLDNLLYPGWDFLDTSQKAKDTQSLKVTDTDASQMLSNFEWARQIDK